MDIALYMISVSRDGFIFVGIHYKFIHASYRPIYIDLEYMYGAICEFKVTGNEKLYFLKLYEIWLGQVLLGRNRTRFRYSPRRIFFRSSLNLEECFNIYIKTSFPNLMETTSDLDIVQGIRINRFAVLNGFHLT